MRAEQVSVVSEGPIGSSCFILPFLRAAWEKPWDGKRSFAECLSSTRTRRRCLQPRQELRNRFKALGADMHAGHFCLRQDGSLHFPALPAPIWSSEGGRRAAAQSYLHQQSRPAARGAFVGAEHSEPLVLMMKV